MRRTIPSIEGGRLYQSETSGDPIIVGTSAWYDWLEHHSAFLFADRVGGFTARKNGPGEREWEASHTRLGKLYRVSLGYSVALTLSRLQEVAQSLIGEHVPVEPIGASAAKPATPPLPVLKTAVPVGPPSSLIRTKLYRPRATSDMVPRARLLQRLNAGLSGKATLVCAPAGFGKTTLLVKWLQTCERTSVWLSLDATDNELPVFVHVLTAALQAILPDAFGATASLLAAARFPPVGQVATLLINDLADLPEDVILVLDDYHLIHNSDVHALLELLIRHLPAQLHLVLAARSDPPLPLVKWRAQGHLNELRSTDLRFTLAETHDFLTRVLGSVATHETALALEERAEGWIAVLRLAALSLRGTADPAVFLERLRSSPDRTVSSYLVEEILSRLASAVQELLERTSMLDQFCAELCVAIMGDETPRERVRASLDWVERSNLFLVPLDERQGWYRFHHLFRVLLQQRLQEHSSTEEMATLHRRASAWYAGQGLIEESLQHALAAGDKAGAARLVEGQFLRAFEQDQWMQMEHWLRLLPEEQILGSPGLLVARVWILQAHGQLTEHPRLLMAAEQLLESNGSGARHPCDRDNPQCRLLHALIAIWWCQFQYGTGQVQATLESARSALEWTPPGEEFVAVFAMQFLAGSFQATGQEDVALGTLQQALRDQSMHLTSTARLLNTQACIYHAAGKLPQLEHTARHLLRVAQDAGMPICQYWAHWYLGMVYYEWNDLDAAVYHFSAVIANQHLASFWAVQEAMCVLAFAYQAQGLVTQAQETTRALLEWVQKQHNLPQLLTAYAFCGHLALVQDEVEEAGQWLEMAGVQEVRGPMMFFEDPPLTKAWMLLAQGDQASVAQGQALLTALLQHVEAMHSTRKTIQVLVLQALAYDLQGRVTEALDVLERALVLGRHAGFVRTFADVPKLSRLLLELRKRRKVLQVVDSKMDAYLQRILVAMNPGSAQAVSMEELLRQEGLEPLTERELNILRLLDKDLTNKEIARALVVTPGTVKVHTTNVYRKLGVNNRRTAVSLAKALGLLAAG